MIYNEDANYEIYHEGWQKNGSFGFACVLGSVRGQKQMCHFCRGLRILKFLRAGQVPIESTEFSCRG